MVTKVETKCKSVMYKSNGHCYSCKDSGYLTLLKTIHELRMEAKKRGMKYVQSRYLTDQTKTNTQQSRVLRESNKSNSSPDSIPMIRAVSQTTSKRLMKSTTTMAESKPQIESHSKKKMAAIQSAANHDRLTKKTAPTRSGEALPCLWTRFLQTYFILLSQEHNNRIQKEKLIVSFVKDPMLNIG